MKSRILGLGLCAGWLLATPIAHAADVSLEDQVHEFRLDNGLTLLVVENHDSPTIGAVTAFSVGTAEEKPGAIGVTHILEHVLFKGTTEIGTTDWEAEKPHHDRIEELTQEIFRLKAEYRPDEGRIAELLEERLVERNEAKTFAVDNELMGLYEGAGATNLNAFTSPDITAYIQSTPSNRLELWMYLESGRLRDPVLRQFYTELENVQEERRLSVEGQPGGKLIENLLAVAFDEHGYGLSGIGYPADIDGITRTETEDWFKVYYAPNRLTIALVGDVDPDDAHKMVKDYFGDIPRQDPPTPLETFDIEKKGMRRVDVEFDAEPRIMMAWPKRCVPHPDDAALRAISAILTGGKSSRFEKRLVRDRQIASSVSMDHETPGLRWDNLVMIEGTPLAPNTAGDLEAAIWEELDLLRREGVTQRELQKAKNRIRADRVRSFSSNLQLAVELGMYQAAHGDWRVLTAADDAVQALTTEDIHRVARATFRKNRAVIATLVEPEFEPDPEMEAVGRELVAAMVDALGGEKALAAIETFQVNADVTIHTPGGELVATSETSYRVPNSVRSNFSMFGQSQVQVTAPEGSWRTQAGAAIDLEGEQLAEVRTDLERDLFLLAYPTVANDYVLQGSRPEGEAAQVEVYGPSGKSFVVHFGDDGLPAAVHYEGTHPMSGGAAEFVEQLSDFREASGILRAHRVVTEIDGTPFADSSVGGVLVNPELAADAFAKPTG